MTNKNIEKAKGRVKEAAGALTGNRRLKTKRVSTTPRARRRTQSTRSPTRSPAASKANSKCRNARSKPTET
ncbi:MAG: hypothetical protein ACXVHB_25690 [Solirubrobacteraceae bacterium]